LPKPKHETLKSDAAIKTIKDAELLVNSVNVAKDEPLGIAQDASVVVDSAEYVPNIYGVTHRADNTSTAPSLVCIPRTANSSVRPLMRLFSVWTQAYTCTSLESAMSCATPNCSLSQEINEHDYSMMRRQAQCVYFSKTFQKVPITSRVATSLTPIAPVQNATTCGVVSALQWIAVDLLSTCQNASLKSYRVLRTTLHLQNFTSAVMKAYMGCHSKISSSTVWSTS
jgi:hypothetical protein